MVGTRVVKLFTNGAGSDVEYTGYLKSYYDVENNWYHVKYTDGDEEDLSFTELRVPAWKPIDRRSVLWLDEKHKEIVLVLASKDE